MPEPNEAELAKFGLRLDDFGDRQEVYPDVLPAANVLIAMATQWRTGYAGATGLDYSALPHVFRLLGVRKRDRPSLFEDLRVMESEALRTMRDSRDG